MSKPHQGRRESSKYELEQKGSTTKLTHGMASHAISGHITAHQFQLIFCTQHAAYAARAGGR